LESELTCILPPRSKLNGRDAIGKQTERHSKWRGARELRGEGRGDKSRDLTSTMKKNNQEGGGERDCSGEMKDRAEYPRKRAKCEKVLLRGHKGGRGIINKSPNRTSPIGIPSPTNLACKGGKGINDWMEEPSNQKNKDRYEKGSNVIATMR